MVILIPYKTLCRKNHEFSYIPFRLVLEYNATKLSKIYLVVIVFSLIIPDGTDWRFVTAPTWPCDCLICIFHFLNAFFSAKCTLLIQYKYGNIYLKYGWLYSYKRSMRWEPFKQLLTRKSHQITQITRFGPYVGHSATFDWPSYRISSVCESDFFSYRMSTCIARFGYVIYKHEWGYSQPRNVF